MTALGFAALFVLVAVAAFIQGTSGMGFALITAPVFALRAPELLPAALLVLMVPLNASVAWQERRSIDRHGATWITWGRLAGAVIGAAVLVLLSARSLSLAVGFATILAALLSLYVPAFKPTSRAFVFAGVATGITETATGIGGPPLALVYQHERPATLRATLALCFLIGELFSLVLLAASGRVMGSHLGAVLALMPAVALGLLASRPMRQRVPGNALRLFVLGFSLVSGAALILLA